MRPSASKPTVFGTRLDVIDSSGADLILEDADFETTLPFAVRGGPNTTIRNSIISHGMVTTDGILTVDRSTFLAGSAIQTFTPGGTITVMNSVFVSSPGNNALTISGTGDTTSNAHAHVINNTFSGGGVSCNGSTIGITKHFEANIFYNIDALAMRGDCFYEYNLILPMRDVVGINNITGDPAFVDGPHNDFHLTVASPAVDAGNASTDFPNGHDREGKPRPAGQRVDLGAYEYSP
jgi:hypothetical protein